ncbi:MAG: ATP-binding cassette domain-containing protein [Phycisphaeraceae bacterium]|nr:MAG: ATP-binding cassette domain-containing protein [Phycisphaeraceae bacterium]
MIDVRDIRKSFGAVQALRGVSFQASAGQVVGLLGPNGAGKTTTIRVITGYLPPTSGFVTVDGLDSIEDTRAVRSRIGYMPESTPLYPEMRVEDYLRHRGRLFGMRRRALRLAIDRVIERCWLAEVRRRRTGELSKGFKQRVGLASALLHDPPVLILDEPTSGLDPTQIVETRRLVRDLGTDKTMLISSHILPEVELTCDRIVVIAHGQVRADGAITDLVRPDRGAGLYIIEARSRAAVATGAEDVIGVALRRLAGVAKVSENGALENGWRRYEIMPETDAPDLRERLASATQESGAIVRELRRDTPTLEQIFIRLIDAPGAEASESKSPELAAQGEEHA